MRQVKIKARSVLTGIVSHIDMMPTSGCRQDNLDVKESSTATPVGSMTYKVRLDGYNQIPYLTGGGEEREPERRHVHRP